MSEKGKLLKSDTIIKLAKEHSNNPFSVVDEAMIAYAGLAYFSATDLSLVTVSDVVTERGQVVIENMLLGAYASNGKERLFYIGNKTYLHDVTTRVIKWRIENRIKCLDRGLFAGLAPESRLFLKPNGEEFSLVYKNRFEGDVLTQPFQIQRKFKAFYLPEGVSLATLMDSFIENFWLKKSSQGTVQAIADLMKLTGLTKETLRTKCIREQTSIQDILKNLYK